MNVTGDLTANAVLQIDGTLGVAGDLTANDNVTVNGQINITGTNNDFNMSGSATSPVNTLGGTGTISIADGFIAIRNANKEISSGASLTLSSGGLDVGSSLTVTNNGSISIGGDLVGGAGSNWINAANSSLTINANVFTTNGSLSASAVGNTVVYAGTGNNDIKEPSDSYYNLSISPPADEIKTFRGSTLDIDGDFNLPSGRLLLTSATTKINLAGDWNNTGLTIRGSNDPEVIFDGTSNQTIINMNTAVLFDSITVNKQGGALIIQAGSSAIIKNLGGVSFINGIIQTSTTGRLIFQNGAGGAGTNDDGNGSSYVDGPVIKVGNNNFNFPIGDGSIWAPLSVDNLTAASTDTIAVEYFNSAPPAGGLGTLNNVSTVEYWDIDVIAGGSYETDITFFWKDQSRSGITESTDLRIAHLTGGVWQEIAQSAISFGASGSITVANISSFSPFTFASGTDTENPLPVDLISFEARLVDNKAELTWATASEVNNDFFEVQRSEDGKEWEVVGEVDGNGTVNEVINYNFTDPRPLFGKSFYRLRQVDFDGQFEYSHVVSINNHFTGEAMEVLVFPNPTEASNINLRVLTGNKENRISVQLIDALGHRFIDENMNPEVFNQDLIISPRESLARGVYFLIVTQNSRVVRQRVVIN